MAQDRNARQYEHEITHLDNLSFDSIIELSEKFVPEPYKNRPWCYPELDRGKAKLITNEQLCSVWKIWKHGY